MADRIVENADQIVDEMNARARRRLVGAIVLALAAAIILPMLLEKEPRPLGDDVSVKIPPVDEGSSSIADRQVGRCQGAAQGGRKSGVESFDVQSRATK
jgi:DedD protein